MPTFHESSNQRVLRDSDNSKRAWLKDRTMARQLGYDVGALSKLQRDVARIKNKVPRPGHWFFVGQLFRVFPDYLQCYPFDESTDTLGNDLIVVAKEYKHRCSKLYPGMPGNANPLVSLGVSHTYTFADNIDANGINNQTRTDSYSSTTENQRIIPPWVLGDIIYAVSCPSIIVDPAPSPPKMTNWLYHAGSRQWAKI